MSGLGMPSASQTAAFSMGIIQILCLKCEGKSQVSDFRYLRTPSRQVISEASMMEYLRRFYGPAGRINRNENNMLNAASDAIS